MSFKVGDIVRCVIGGSITIVRIKSVVMGVNNGIHDFTVTEDQVTGATEDEKLEFLAAELEDENCRLNGELESLRKQVEKKKKKLSKLKNEF